MRDNSAIWAAWRSGVYVGDARPATRVTVEKGWKLGTTEPVLGTWNKGPARWFQGEDPDLYLETEVPNVISVNLSRALDSDSGSCDIVVRNTRMPGLGEPEGTPGQFGTPGYYTWDHGGNQDAKARWGHVANPWQEVLVPNALLRTYQGFGGHDKTVEQAVADGNVVLNGIWLVDDVTINTDGTLTVKCRDMAKLLIDQQLFPPLIPTDRYPLDYRRWIYKIVEIPGDPVPVPGDHCYGARYTGSSTDEYYGEFNSAATGHPPSDAFDISPEPGPDIPGAYAHQRTYWLSEPKGSPSDTAWIEFDVENGLVGDVNQIYYHAWKGVREGHGVHRIMVSVFEHGQWVPGETALGGVTPEGLPYVTTFSPAAIPGEIETHLYGLPRDYRATKIRLTVTSLILATDFPPGIGDPFSDWEHYDGGWRAGARKIMACFSQTVVDTRLSTLTYTSASIPKNDDNRQGYWQVRANGQVFAFGDARVYDATSPANAPLSTVIGMAVHPGGLGYWYVDVAGRVVSAGAAGHFGDLSDTARTDVTDIAPAPDGEGYWLLALDGTVHGFGSAIDYGPVGDSTYSASMANGTPAWARAIESHPTIQGYWVLWSDGAVTARNLTHYGNGFDHTGWTLDEYAPCLRRTSTGNGYWIMSGSGKVQAKGDAVHHGDAALTGYDQDNWYKGICWELFPSSVNDDGYAIQSADGNLWLKGKTAGLAYGSIGAGKATQRLDGNYKDYADIIKDLALWAGFYLYNTPAPEAEFPAIYGNIETTGAYAEDPLPRDMFDKKPIMDAIKAIRDIVGYVVWVDAEGGFRFESPNWWALGNFLIDGTPLAYMPEVDETAQLIGHSVTRSASQARSRIIISTADPYPAIPGQATPKGVVTTEVVPATAADLRGLVVPAMWINGQFLRKDEQKVMADLIDMRSWFSRRTASISCVANPLIDVNDQVRVIERQTGEVYVHYVRSINVSHDLMSGDFKMDLTTHWLGGTPYGVSNSYYATDSLPAGDGYWKTTITGQVYPFGDAELYERHQTDSHLEWVIGFRSTPSGLGYYTLDTSGKILTYGDAEHYGELADPTNNVIDFAVTPTGAGYWVLQKDGTVTGFGDAVFYGNAVLPAPVSAFEATIPNALANTTAQSIESHPSTQGYWVLLSDGEVQAFNLTHHGNATREGYTTKEYATVLRATTDGGGYYVPSGGGDNVQVFGNAVFHGAGIEYPESQWANGLVWDMLVNDAGGYALQRADGTLESFDFTAHDGAGEATLTAQWALVSPDAGPSDPGVAFTVSKEVMGFLAGTASPSANNAVANNFAAPAESTVRGPT